MNKKERYEKMLKDYSAILDKVAEIQKENPEIRTGIDCTTINLHGAAIDVFNELGITNYIVDEYEDFICMTTIYNGKYVKGIICKNGNWKENSSKH